MKFGHLFEYHKIPEWYTEYVKYRDLRNLIDEFKQLKKVGRTRQLKGYWTINSKHHLFCIDFIKNYKEGSPKLKRAERARSAHFNYPEEVQEEFGQFS